MGKEIWKPIRGYEGLYEVSNLGRVRSLARTDTGYRCGRKPTYDKELAYYLVRGYYAVVLYKRGKQKHFLVHRLVADAFIPNPNNYPQINHKDENPKNNIVDNLEWCTGKYNVNYGKRKEKWLEHENVKAQKKAVIQVSKDGNFINEFESMTEAAKCLGLNKRDICACCRGKQSHTHKTYWRYKE